MNRELQKRLDDYGRHFRNDHGRSGWLKLPIRELGIRNTDPDRLDFAEIDPFYFRPSEDLE